MVELGTIYFIIQIILMTTMILGSYYGRKLDMYWHHRLIYAVLTIQLVIFLLWMGPGVAYYSSINGITVVLALHMVTGTLSFISCAILAFIFLKDKNRFTISKLRWTRPLMIFTLFIWSVSFVFGSIFYFQTYV